MLPAAQRITLGAQTPTYEVVHFPKVNKEEINELSELIHKRGRELFSPDTLALLNKYESPLSPIDLEEMLKEVKRSSKEIAKTYHLPYDRITTNLVRYPEQSYLMTRHPHTVEEQRLFWGMVLEYQSPAVVVLLIPNEKEVSHHELEYCKPECFPLDLGNDWCVTFAENERHVVARGKDGCQIVERTMRFINSKTKEERSVLHYHYEGWPNKMGAPDQRLFEQLIDMVDRASPDKERPLTVHCAIGRGRSATFVLGHVIKRMLAASKPINLAALLMHGRLQRDGFLESKSQMETIYQYMIDHQAPQGSKS